jgi:hypothetical protein
MKKHIVLLLVLFSVMWIGSGVNAAIIVGRISHVDGQIYRYMDVDDSWVATSVQSPAGTQDVLLTGDESKVEIAFPNNQLVRLNENTEIEILNLDEDIGEFTLHSGLARFYNRSSEGKLVVETARGTAQVAPDSAIDVLVYKKSVTVSAVRGEAIFYSYKDGVEKEDVISGSTSLEFREESIIASIGPIDRKWDRWCADREGVWTKNRLVRSEHLPESMQEYAYVMEPNGRWQRVYYRGYYYWAWKPHSVAVGWSPYTTGYWYDWHGSSAWIDYNPWGWATHHHGNWINMHGAWLWTPYIHVSHVPGVTVVGFNIRFGKRYRPHWHPGRVRWIAHNDHVGWLPLAPWETHYGYRKWGPRTVVVRGGASLSININLSNHRYIDHAVIIPRRHLYNRKHGVTNNYNTVKIKNINKRTIVKNYKPLATAERLRDRKHSTEVARVRNTERRIKTQRERKAEQTRKVIRRGNHERNRDGSITTQRDMPTERTVARKYEKERNQTIDKKHSGAIENKRADDRNKATRERVARSEQRPRERIVKKREKESIRSNITATTRSEKTQVTREDRKQKKTREVSQTEPDTSRRQRVVKKNTAETNINRQQTKRENRQAERRAARNENSANKAYKKGSREYRANEKPAENSRERQTARNSYSGREREASRDYRKYRQGFGNGRYSASMNNRRFR